MTVAGNTATAGVAVGTATATGRPGIAVGLGTGVGPGGDNGVPELPLPAFVLPELPPLLHPTKKAIIRANETRSRARGCVTGEIFMYVLNQLSECSGSVTRGLRTANSVLVQERAENAIAFKYAFKCLKNSGYECVSDPKKHDEDMVKSTQSQKKSRSLFPFDAQSRS